MYFAFEKTPPHQPHLQASSSPLPGIRIWPILQPLCLNKVYYYLLATGLLDQNLITQSGKAEKQSLSRDGTVAGENACLPPIWPSFYSWTWHHKWVEFVGPFMHLSMVCPRMGGRQPRGIGLCKAHLGWDFDIHNDPQGGKFDSTAILKS